MLTARRLLVAAPTMLDPNFFRTVVFMIEHTEEGALGIVLNRPSEAELDSALPDWAGLAASPSVAFVGGPVQLQEALIGVARARGVEGAEGWQPLLGNVGIIDLSSAPADTPAAVEAVRVFAGYAGWGPGQLESELAQHAWYVVDALPDDVLAADTDSLWRAVLRRQGGELAVVANFPFDPAVN